MTTSTVVTGPVARRRTKAAQFLALTKPRVIELLLIATVPSMVLASEGRPSWWLVLATLTAGALAAGSANAINCYIDRDIDALMRRTKSRPLVRRDLVSPREALVFGILLAIAANVLFLVWVNWQSALLADTAIAIYLGVYSLYLKRRTSLNIVIGGIAGCIPALIGWTAVTGGIGAPAIVIFFIIFLWTPPHTWALAFKYAEDYQRAGVPMLPVVSPARAVTRQMLVYTVLCLIAGVTLAFVADLTPLYLVLSAPTALWFLWTVIRLHLMARVGRPLQPMPVFMASNLFLAVTFIVASVDSLIT
jgi:protoheme IX farnesyltransferase